MKAERQKRRRIAATAVRRGGCGGVRVTRFLKISQEKSINRGNSEASDGRTRLSGGTNSPKKLAARKKATPEEGKKERDDEALTRSYLAMWIEAVVVLVSAIGDGSHGHMVARVSKIHNKKNNK